MLPLRSWDQTADLLFVMRRPTLAYHRCQLYIRVVNIIIYLVHYVIEICLSIRREIAGEIACWLESVGIVGVRVNRECIIAIENTLV